MHIDDIAIRKADLNDLEQVRSCVRTAYAKYIPRIGKEPAPMSANFACEIAEQQIFLATFDQQVVGCVSFYPRRDHMFLRSLAVRPECTGNGIGKKLVRYVEDSARRESYRAIELYTNEAMIENLAMYPKWGYVEIDRKEEDGFRRVYFRKLV